MTSISSLSLGDAQEIARPYGLECLALEIIEEGSENSNFLLVAEEGRFVLTLFEVKDHTAVHRTARLYTHLAEQHFPAPRLVGRPGKGSVGSFKNKPILLKDYLPGKSEGEPDEEQLAALGQQLAHLHLLPTPDYLAQAPAFGVDWMRKLLKKELTPRFGEWLKGSLDEIDRQDWDSLPRGLIHGDLFLDNALFQDDRLIAILDFEEACHYMLAFDIGMALLGCCRTKGDISPRKMSFFLRGYEHVRRLEKDELTALPSLMYYAASITAAWRYWKFNTQTPEKGREELYLEMVRIAEWAKALEESDSLIIDFTS